MPKTLTTVSSGTDDQLTCAPGEVCAPPRTGGLPSGATLVYDPPYSYEDTDKADCAMLLTMINNVKHSIISGTQLPDAQFTVYETWLVYASDKYNAGCSVKAGSPQDPIANPPATPIQHLPDTSEPPQASDIPPTVSSPSIPAATQPDTPIPDILETMFPPVVAPYAVADGSGGGAGGGGSDDATDSNSKNIYWLIVAGMSIVSLLFFKKKGTSKTAA